MLAEKQQTTTVQYWPTPDQLWTAVTDAEDQLITIKSTVEMAIVQ